jgi:SulP family sulfate permease
MADRDDQVSAPATDASSAVPSAGPRTITADVASTSPSRGRRRFPIPILQGVLPIDRARLAPEILAGLTLAALAIPEVMGYSNIAGMPVITGLYTLVLPLMTFAVFGSSRHLVVGADSATAAMMAAGLAGLATTGSSEYIALAGLLALMAGGLMILARLIRLGFIANFLSRTVLIGFLTGVGIQVALGQVGGMLGITGVSGKTIPKFIDTLGKLGETSVTTLAVTVSVLGTIIVMKKVSPRLPGALFAVVGAIVVSAAADLASHGVSTLGHVPRGLPSIGFPSGLTWGDVTELVPTAVSLFVVILAQSAATSRAYAAKYNESFSENTDLVGLGLAEAASMLSGSYVVNGSPTKTQMVDSAGGRSQLAQLAAGAIVIVVLVFLTAPLQYMPNAVLASIVFLIAIELIDIAGMRRVFRLRRDEFVIAALTALVVVVVGVEQGIILAIVLSIIDHLRKSYSPNSAVLVPAGDSQWQSTPVQPNERTMPGLVVYLFGADLYYANASRFLDEVEAILASPDQPPLRWLCIDAGAMFDIDYTGAETMRQAHDACAAHSVQLVFAGVLPPVHAELERAGIVDLVGAAHFAAHVGDVIARFEADSPPPAAPATPVAGPT